MRRTLTIALSAAVVVAGLALASLHVAAQEKKAGTLILRGDMTYFFGPGKPKNCNLNNTYKHGEPVGWRIEAVDPETGKHVEAEAQLVVHLNYAGATKDIPMRCAQRRRSRNGSSGSPSGSSPTMRRQASFASR